MPPFFDPSPDAVEKLNRLTDELPAIQEVLVKNSGHLRMPDRGAHQYQIAGGKVLLAVSKELPTELAGVGLFEPAGERYAGIGRISTGMGCPHLETDPDFLGLLLAFRSRAGQRIDFIGLNSPTAPTNSVHDFLALLRATADSAGTEAPLGSLGELHIGNLIASQFPMVITLVKRLGPVNALEVLGHVYKQTSQTVLSSSAVQNYWTGIVHARDTFGKFTLVPTKPVNEKRALSPGGAYLSKDWQERQSTGDLEFRLYWIPFLNETDTPVAAPMKVWREDHKVAVGTVVFPRVDSQARESKLLALLAMEMGANPGNWVGEAAGSKPREFPATEFTAGRFLAYRKSQSGRNALPEEKYDSYFEAGKINADLASELIARYNKKRALGHSVPDLGDIN